MNLTIGRPQTFQLAELDLDIEFGPRMLAGVKIKAAATVTAADFR